MIWSAAEPSFSAPAYGGYQSWLGEAFPKWGKRLALIEGKNGKSYSFGDLNGIISTVAGNLYHTAGVRKGDVILFNIPNSIEHSILIMATFSLGAIVSGCNPLNTQTEVVRQMKDSNAVYLVTTSSNQSMVPECLHNWRWRSKQGIHFS